MKPIQQRFYCDNQQQESRRGGSADESGHPDRGIRSVNSLHSGRPAGGRCKGVLGLFAAALAVVLAAPAAVAEEKIKALFISGGGFHNYEKTTPYLTEQIGKLIPVEWTIHYGLDAFENENFGESFDVVVFDCCFPGEKNPPGVENVFRAIRGGKPAVLVHCATVCFLALPEWQKLVGHTIKGHDKYRAMQTSKADPNHPVMKRFPDEWKTEGDELYRISVAGEDSHALLEAKSPEDGKEHAVAWTHQYGQGRVFATSLGHDLKTIEDPDYQALLANGILWALGRLEK